MTTAYVYTIKSTSVKSAYEGTSSVVQWLRLQAPNAGGLGLTPGQTRGKRHRFDQWVRKIPWRRKWQPILVLCLENSLGRGARRDTVHEVAESDLTENERKQARN